MRGFFAAIVLIVSMIGIAQAQMGDLTPPPEMKAVDFLRGSFEGNVNFYFGGQKTPSTCSGKGEKALNDKYVQMNISYQMKMQGMPDSKIDGMMMLTYDPVAKQYTGYWFDGTVPFALHVAGNFNGDKLVLISDPTQYTAGAPNAIIRSSWWKQGNDVSFSLEMKNGDKWDPLMDGSFKKS